MRERATVEALWSALGDGTLRWIGSDHSPYPPSLKAGDDVWAAPDGAPSIETCFPLALSEGRRRGLGLERLATLCGAAASRAYGLYPRKGALLPGADELAYADGEVLAPPGSGEWLRSERSESSSEPSPVSAQSTSAPL